MRLWAESKDGDRWLQHKNEDLWLVDKNPKLKSERVYVAEQFGAYTHTFRPQTGVRQFSERTVTLRNKTDKKLKVSLDYLSFEDGNLRWRSAPDFEIPPKATVEVRDKEDLLLRAQAIKFKAVSPEFTFQAHWTTPLWIVDAVEGRRVYRGSKIGNYLHTLEPLE